MSKGTVIFAFALGAAAGSVVTWKLLETKYEQIIQEEIESVKEVFSRRGDKKEIEEGEEEEDVDSEYPHTSVVNQATYEDIMKKYNKSSTTKEGEDVDEPYVIPPEEFGTEDNYETESLTYYADGILTDDADNPIEDIDSLVGADFASHFGEYEDDSVFVRNPEYETDFEILADSRTYAEVVGGVLPTPEV